MSPRGNIVNRGGAEVDNAFRRLTFYHEDSYSENIDMIRKRELENELCTLCDNEYKGVQIRLKAKWIAEGEQITSYHRMNHHL